MIENRLFALLLLLSFPIFSQTKGIVVDENNKPIPYVNIWVEDENVGTSSEENGHFEIKVSDMNKTLVFSSIGFESKKIKVSETGKVILKTSSFKLDELLIMQSKRTKEIEIGKVRKSGVYDVFAHNGPNIYVKYFPFDPKYSKTNFINQMVLHTASEIDDATVRVHVYNVNDEGFPGDELLDRDLLFTVGKGRNKSKIDLSEFNITFPKKGVFVGYELLIIEKNRFNTPVSYGDAKEIHLMKVYYPLVLRNWVDEENTFSYNGGKWHKQKKYKYKSPSNDLKTFEPAISLVLTN
ncbi:hypothetical protein FLJC2902T_05000 [Flavobacterium limnosediminis JC2902]|uniref:Outer membrane protein n=1 Tax=Flavobacterium limnosediminis JC2902 TaxID=1341181 RepID=V6STP3_9FLAO|nr:carboxypeptidase-like regulatory domain-containing protein [Flavobacterium limnosediminis]ESU30011.1 hypothetical protein FLJC2902T_05000 [Flavobacterium limnosediminis JC2902]